MRVGRLLGTELRLDPLMGVFVGVALWLGYLPEVALFAAALVLHELGHLVAAAVEEVAVAEIVLEPFGGVARIPALGQLERRRLVAIALAGPAVSLALAGVAAFALRHGPPLFAAGGRLDLWLQLNLALGVVNLLPVLPLDGGRALGAHLAERVGAARSARTLGVAGRVLGVSLAAVGAVGVAAGRPVADVAVFGLFLWLVAGREAARAPYGRAAALESRRAALARGGVLAVRVLAARRDVALGTVWRAMAAGAYHEVRVLDGDGRPRATLDEGRLYEALVRLGPGATLEESLGVDPDG